MKVNLLEELSKNPFVLAPMAGITDNAFRTFMKRQGAGIVVSELVSATGLEYNSKKTKDLMKFEDEQRPVGIQLFGENPDHMANAAKFIEDLDADFIDINFGCPVPKVVKKGAGSAMLKDLPALQKVVSATVNAVKIPVTIKIRTGWDHSLKNAHEVVKIAANEGVTWVAIHGRTRSQGYEGLADWDYIAEVKANAQIPIIGNGDVLHASQANFLLNSTNVDGVMIGRGALKNPFIFKECQNGLNQSKEKEPSKNFSRLFLDLHDTLVSRCDDHISKIQLKKFAAWFSTGYPGAANFRKIIFQLHDLNDIMLEANKFFESINKIQQEDTSRDGFLMGGHG